MSSSEEKYLGAYVYIAGGLSLDEAVYDWDNKIDVDRFIDAWSERGESPSIWISNWTDHNAFRSCDEFTEVRVTNNNSAAATAINKFQKFFSKELSVLDSQKIDYQIHYGVVTYAF